jgi:hypothetical protein
MRRRRLGGGEWGGGYVVGRRGSECGHAKPAGEDIG